MGFHIGQRVRATRSAEAEALIGLEGLIVAAGTRYPWIVEFPYHGRSPVPHSITGRTNHWGMLEHELSPLSDPAADAFLERLKKLGKEPVIPVHTVPFGD